MFRHCRVRVISAAVAGVAGFFATHRAGASVADFLYEPQQASQTVQTAGSTVSLELFLLANTATGVGVINNNSGLLSAGAAVNVASSTGAASFISSYAFDTADFSGASQVPTITSNGSSMENDSEAVGTGASTGVTFGNTAGGTIVNPAGNNEIYLGTVSLTAGSPNSTTVFNIGENGSSSGSNPHGFTLTFLPSNANGGGYDLDNEAAGNTSGVPYNGVGANVTTFTLHVVPEPGSLGLLGFGSILGLLRRRRLA